MPNTAPSIINEGQTVVVGEVDIQGGSVQTGNQFYIFDDAPTYSNNGPSVDGITYNGSNGSSLTTEFPTESSIPPPLLAILDGLGVSCGGYNSISGVQTICNNSTPASLTGSAVSGVTYLWESSTTSATTGFTMASGTSNGQNYSPGSLSQTTWYRRRITKASPACTHYSPAIQVTVFVGSVWTGANGNNNLNTPGNWCGGVPTATTNALIPSGLDSWRYPTAGSLTTKDLVIQSGASLNINDNQSVTVNGNLSNGGTITAAWNNPSLNLYGNFTNTGTLTFNSSTAGTIRFQGSSQQTVTGGPYAFPNMTIVTGTSQVLFSSDVTVNGTFTLTSGVINMSGYVLTLGTATWSTGTLAYTAGRIANGTFTRYVANGSQTNFRFPMGTVTDNRPFYFTTTSNITTGGTMSVTHTGGTTNTTGLNISDGGTIVRRQNSYWTVTTNTLAGGIFNVFAGGTGFGIIGDITDLRLMRAGSTVPSSTHVNATGTLSSGNYIDFIAQRNGVSLVNLTGGAIYVGSIDPVVTPLPIKLVSFNGALNPDGVQLTWVTAMEKEFDYFLLERASKNLDFTEVAQIDGRGGLNTTTTYNYLDTQVLLGKNYYRLKSVDLDGTYEYSNVVLVESNLVLNHNTVLLYPNPARGGQFFIRESDEFGTPIFVIIYNCQGQEILRKNLENSYEVNLPPDQRKGVLLVKVRFQEGVKTEKLVVN